MEMNLINAGITVVGVLIANFGIKLGRVYPLVKQVYSTVETYIEAKRDGKLNQSEKAKLFDEISADLKEAWSIIKGLSFFKSKVIN